MNLEKFAEIIPLTEISIVLSIYNQEKIIERILERIIENTKTPFTLILVFDGCTDNTQAVALGFLDHAHSSLLKSVIVRETKNIYETRANNEGFNLVQTPYFVTLQDDMSIEEEGWEVRLTLPLRMYQNVFAVTGRMALDIREIKNSRVEYMNRSARELCNLSRNVFAVRDIINRGPIAFDTSKLRKLGLLNETYSPGGLDDADLSLRAWENEGWFCGAYWINYISKPHWSKSKASDSTMNIGASFSRNAERLLNDHRTYIEGGQKHSRNVPIPASSTDYPIVVSRTKLRIKISISAFPYIFILLTFHSRRLFHTLLRKGRGWRKLTLR